MMSRLCRLYSPAVFTTWATLPLLSVMLRFCPLLLMSIFWTRPLFERAAVSNVRVPKGCELLYRTAYSGKRAGQYIRYALPFAPMRS